MADDPRLFQGSAALLGGPTVPTAPIATCFTSNAGWHTDQGPRVGGVKFLAHLQRRTAGTGALRVVPGSHDPAFAARVRGYWSGDPALQGLDGWPVPYVVLETEPGDVIAFDLHLYHSSAGGQRRLAWTIEYLPWPGLADPERLRLVRDLVVDTVDFDHEGYDRQRWPTWRGWEAGARSVPSRQVAVERLRLLGVLGEGIHGEPPNHLIGTDAGGTAMDNDSGTAKERLLELYEARGEPDTFAQAKRVYEQALAGAGASDPAVLVGYGYLLECHGRYSLRQAVAQYERAIALDPDADKPHYQLIGAYAALGEPEWPVARYQQRLAQSPGEVREHRFLANAYLAARNYGEAARVVDAGLALAPDDRLLLEVRGQVRAVTGDPEGALADWRRAVDPDHNLGPVYSSAFLLERLGRLQEAVAAWQFIIDWCQSHDAPLTAEWPRRELERLRGRLSDG